MQTCKHCSVAFSADKNDHAFLAKLSPVVNGITHSLPDPSLCPDCRMRSRLVRRNIRCVYRTTCEKCERSMISMYHPNSPYPDYCGECFWSDSWDPCDSGAAFDFGKTFSEQFRTLCLHTPSIGVLNMRAENSEYCNKIYDGRNNYLSFIALFQPENLLYTYYTMSCKDCVDIAYCQKCELCYECVDAENCYRCLFGTRIRNCNESAFLEDCVGCTHCFGCKNLVQKSFCVFNEQKTQEEYKAFMGKVHLDDPVMKATWEEKTRAFFLTLPHRSVYNVNAENVVGANVTRCRDCYQVFDFYESERMRRCFIGEQSHDCMDCSGFGRAEFCYECISFLGGAHNICCSDCPGISELLYCSNCFNDTSNCFGCTSMKKGKYCILNKQFTKEQYEELVPRIIEHMGRTGEWGEFFRPEVSPFGYNETDAQEYFPSTNEGVAGMGYLWCDYEPAAPEATKRIDASAALPPIGDVSDDILHWAIVCEITGKLFKVTKQELDFYRSNGLPIPRVCWDARHTARMGRRAPPKLWERDCAHCGRKTPSSYRPSRSEIVYCEECYLATVY